MSSETTHFLNVDLELIAGAEIDPLLAEWGAMVMLRDSVDDGVRTIWIELEEDHADAESTIDGFLSLVESLPAPLRTLWDACRDRCFNVGIQSGSTPPAATYTISPRTLSRMASVKARVAFTVYGAMPDPDRALPMQAKR